MSIRTGKYYLTPEQVLAWEKAIYDMSPAIKRYNEKKDKEFKEKKWVVPTFNKKLIKELKKKETEVLENINFTQVHWLDYIEA